MGISTNWLETTYEKIQLDRLPFLGDAFEVAVPAASSVAGASMQNRAVGPINFGGVRIFVLHVDDPRFGNLAGFLVVHPVSVVLRLLLVGHFCEKKTTLTVGSNGWSEYHKTLSETGWHILFVCAHVSNYSN